MRQLSEHVIVLGNPHANIFLVGRQKAVIVECGVSGAVMNFKEQWERLDHKPEVEALVILHAHFDHVCGVPGLKKIFPQAKIIAGAKAKRILAKPKIIRHFFQQDQAFSKVALEQGLITETPEIPDMETIAVDQVAGEGDRITLEADNISLEFLETPGHSPCSLSCYLPEDRVMFLSDAAGFQISDQILFPLFFQGYQVYLDSLKKLEAYPAKVLALPHEKIWEGEETSGFYQRSQKAAREFFETISLKIMNGVEEEKIREEIFSEFYREDLVIYTPENIRLCVEIMLKRVKEVI